MRKSNFNEVTAKSIKVGDMVSVDPEWNRTTGETARRFTKFVRVRSVKHEHYCQTGTLVEVEDNGGDFQTMSAAWFAPTTGAGHGQG